MAEEKLDILGRISDVQRILELLKRDLIKESKLFRKKKRISLFGSVKGGDVTEEMVEEAKRALFTSSKNAE